jgi:hypothetical protein
VVQGDEYDVDVVLANAVLAEMESDGRFERSIQWFNQANTDSPSIREEFELIALINAFHQLLGLRGTSDDAIAHAFEDALAAVVPTPKGLESSRPRVAEALSSGKSLRWVWMSDLYHLRGSGAHGHATDGGWSGWSAQEHLFLGALLFPLVAKVVLSEKNRRALQPEDHDALEDIDRLLSTDHLFDQGFERAKGTAASRRRRRAISRAYDAAVAPRSEQSVTSNGVSDLHPYPQRPK